MESLTLMCVHPHPDDESIACGGVLARYADEGLGTHVVTCTGGEAGENLAGIDLGDHDLPWHRRRELADAIAALGVDRHTWLGYRDSGMAGTDDNHHSDAFAAADREEAAARLARVVREARPQVVVSDDEHGTYGHPDHVQAHHVTTRALELAADASWDPDQPAWRVPKRYVHAISRARMWEIHQFLLGEGLASPFGDTALAGPDDLPFGVRDEDISTRVTVEQWIDRKQAAMRAHRSQIGDDSFFFNLPDGAPDIGMGVEEFVLLDGRGSERQIEDDLFAGLR